MNLYLITQSEISGYDTYISAVVAAKSENDAKLIHPSNVIDGAAGIDGGFTSSMAWASRPSNVTAAYLGRAARSVKRGIILASFNAG